MGMGISPTITAKLSQALATAVSRSTETRTLASDAFAAVKARRS